MNENAFELAIFRVYDRSMENLRDDDVPHEGSMSLKTCRVFERILIGMMAFFMLVLMSLHIGIVGRVGCLPALLEQSRVAANRTTLFPSDAILQISVDPRFYDNQIDLTDDDIDDDVFGDERRRTLRDSSSSLSYLEGAGLEDISVTNTFSTSDPDIHKDEDNEQRLLNKQLSIYQSLSGGQSKGALMPYKSMASVMGSALYTGGEFLWQAFGGTDRVASDVDAGTGSAPSRYLLSTNSSTNTSTNSTNTGPRYDPKYFKSYDYEFAHDLGVLSLSNTLRAKHNFTLVNVSFYGSECFGNSLLQAFLPLGGVDMLVMNNVMFSLQSKGGMLISSRNDFYIWKKEGKQTLIPSLYLLHYYSPQSHSPVFLSSPRLHYYYYYYYDRSAPLSQPWNVVGL
jgi:hypothetical protein